MTVSRGAGLGNLGAGLGMAQLLQALTTSTNGSGFKGGGKGGKGKDGKGGRTWKCIDCGFENKPSNDVCGGSGGTLGCKAPKPEDWVCDCGFRNKASNEVCGGTGPMGCNSPKPDV